VATNSVLFKLESLCSLGNWRFSWQAITVRRQVIIGK
ncbi:MAG: hypothetical protein ACJAR8_000140, partial [Bacteroidia bacterium]